MNKEDFVSFEQAKRLKKLGFDWNCNHYIDERGKISENTKDDFFHSCYEDLNDANFALHDKSGNLLDYYSAPTLAQACKWLRSKDILIHILPKSNNKYMTQVWEISCYEILETLRGEFDTYEQAQSAGIDFALGMLEKSSNEQ